MSLIRLCYKVEKHLAKYVPSLDIVKINKLKFQRLKHPPWHTEVKLTLRKRFEHTFESGLRSKKETLDGSMK